MIRKIHLCDGIKLEILWLFALLVNHGVLDFYKSLWADFLCLNALVLSKQDCRSLTVSPFPLVLIACGGGSWLLFQKTIPLGLPIFLIFLAIFAYGFSKKIGLGDIILLAACGLWFEDSQAYGLFLFLSGILGVTTHAVYPGDKVPFAPSILIACWLCFVFS
jgi:Flp pilus assembly protein protease CpaA